MDDEDNDIFYYTGGKVENKRITKVVVEDGVRKIDHNAFAACQKIRSITIPNSVTSIGKHAFDLLVELETISIPESVKTIGDSAFSWCKSLKAIAIPEGVTKIEEGTFWACDSLETITLPKSLTKIGKGAFEGCFSLKAIVIPEGVTDIEVQAFDSCRSLKSIQLPKSLTKIGQKAFFFCTALEQIEIPTGVKAIGDYSFRNCRSLPSICIPNGIKIIPTFAFYDCASLHTVTLPPTIEGFGRHAFSVCKNLENFVIPNGLPALEDGFSPLDVGFEFNSWKGVKQILENASNLTRMIIKNHFVGEGCAIDSIKDDDILKVLELVSAGPTLREVDLSTRNCLTVGVFEKLVLQDIPGHLRLLDIKDQSPRWRWRVASSSPEYLIQVLERNPKLVIKTDRFWHDSEDEKVRHRLDMNEYGCRSFTVRDSHWPELIETLALLEAKGELRTGTPNILYHLFCRQLNVLINYPQDDSSSDQSEGATSVKRPRHE